MSGLKPAVIGLISSAVISIGTTVFFPAGYTLGVFTSPAFYVSLVIFAAALILVLKMKKLSPIYIIIGSAALGIAAGYLFNLPL
jgi:chromate transporter